MQTTTATPSERRRLAANVICLFTDDRPPVVNDCTTRRGRRPRNIIRFRERPLEIGDICELCRGAIPSNHGKLVRITGWNQKHGGYDVESVRGLLDVRDIETGKPDGESDTAIVAPANLRRVSSLTRRAAQ